MNYRTATLAALACSACLIIAVILAGCLASAAVAAPPQCYEDEPCWSWSTMGNLSRGVFVKDRKTVRVVEPCRFAALDFHGKIDWKRTTRLKGDSFARAHGCNPYLYA